MKYTKDQLTAAAAGKSLTENGEYIGVEFNDYVWTWFRQSILGGYDFDHIYSSRTGKTRKSFSARFMTYNRIDKQL
jgi:hypothetical protein